MSEGKEGKRVMGEKEKGMSEGGKSKKKRLMKKGREKVVMGEKEKGERSRERKRGRKKKKAIGLTPPLPLLLFFIFPKLSKTTHRKYDTFKGLYIPIFLLFKIHLDFAVKTP